MIKLSILIPVGPKHTEIYKEVRDKIIETTPVDQLEFVEILTDFRGSDISTGKKRHDLHQRAKGEYVWFIDADDMIEDYAMEEVLKGIESGADVICFNGYMTTNGANRVDWEIRLGHPYEAIRKDGKEYYLRHPNHISPMKRELALQVKFPNKMQREDYDFAVQLLKAGILKTEYIIDKFIYYYNFQNPKLT